MSIDTSRQRQEMLEINRKQRAFYDQVRSSRSFERSSGSLASRLWSKVRYRLWDFQEHVNMRRIATDLHREHLGAVGESRVLDLGCGNGSDLTFWLAEHAREYIGIDLADLPVRELNEKFELRGFTSARAESVDFLENSFPDGYFDVIYAAAVLHHFRDIQVLVEELLRILASDGVILSYDPLQTEPLNRFVRGLYRKRQDDRDWEWPFTRERLQALTGSFDVLAVQGVLGMSKLGFPFFLIPGLRPVGRSIATWGMGRDADQANHLGSAFYRCWHFAMVMRKPG